MPEGELSFNHRPQEKLKEKLITHRSWRTYTAYLAGPHGEVKAECRQREEGPGAHALWGSVRRVLGPRPDRSI